MIAPARSVLVVVGTTAHVGARVGSGPLLLSEACNLQLSETRGRKELELADAKLGRSTDRARP
jgi:hypothetical protein